MLTTDIRKKVGKQLNKLRIIRNFNEIGDFGKAFNNGRKHKGFSAYIKGTNMRFDTLIKCLIVLKVGLPTLFDFDDIHPIDKFYKDLPSDELSEYWLRIFQENITFYRTSMFKTQLDFEQAFGVERANISNYETGKTKPTLLTIQRFAEVFGIDPIHLFIKREGN